MFLNFNHKFFSATLLAFGVLLASACGTSDTSEKAEKIDSGNLKMAETDKTAAVHPDVFTQLKRDCDYADYIFYDQPISFSQTEINGIRQVVDFIDRESTSMPKGCSPTAMVAFLGAGEIIAEGDLYFLDGCSYFVFFDEDRQPTHSHQLNQAGTNYFNNVLNQYFETIRQQQNQ